MHGLLSGEFRRSVYTVKTPTGCVAAMVAGGVLVTSGFCRVLSEAHDRVMEKLKKDPDYLVRLHEKFKTWTL